MQAGIMSEISVNAPNHIAVTVDMTSATWNTVATHKVFAVTGVVRMRMWIQSHSLTSNTNEAYMSLLVGAALEVFRAGKIENTNGFWVGQNAYQAFCPFDQIIALQIDGMGFDLCIVG